MRQRTALPILLLSALLAAACGGEGSAEAAATSAPGGRPYSNRTPRDASTPASSAAQTPTRPAPTDGGGSEPAPPPAPVDTGATGTISGVVLWEGAAPEMPLIGAVESTPGCHKGETPRKETILVNDGRLANVFVYVSDGYDESKVPAPAREPVIVDQFGCVFRPHVVGVQTGRMVHALNNDELAHNVRVSAKKNDGPNRTIGPGAAPMEIELTREEVPVAFVCDLHPWMSAYVCAVEHPWFAVSAADGTFEIENVPAGTYTLSVWHESRNTVGPRKLKDVVVSSEADTPVEISFKGK